MREFRKTIEAHIKDMRENHPEIVEEARRRGYEPATASDRRFNDHRDLFSWRGTVWKKLEKTS